jgi:hypothetical protein
VPLYAQPGFLVEQKKQLERDLLREAKKHPIVRIKLTHHPARWAPRSGAFEHAAALEALAVALAAHHDHPMRLMDGASLPPRS